LNDEWDSRLKSFYDISGPSENSIESRQPSSDGTKTIEFGSASEHWKLLGNVIKVPQPNTFSNLDWALIQIECPDFKAFIRESAETPRKIDRIAEALLSRKKSAVHVLMSSSGLTTGTLTTSPSYIQLSNSTAFQEMWTVQLDGPLREYKILGSV
jgi:hypothetical protein